MASTLMRSLRETYPASLDQVAIEATDGERLDYSWRDVERGSAMLANLLASLDLPAGTRLMSRVDRSIEALLLGLAVLRVGWVLVPVDPAGPAEEVATLIAGLHPAVLVCRTRDFQGLSRLAFTAGTARVFTLDDDRSGSLLQRAAVQPDVHEPVEVAADAPALILDSGRRTLTQAGLSAGVPNEAAALLAAVSELVNPRPG